MSPTTQRFLLKKKFSRHSSHFENLCCNGCDINSNTLRHLSPTSRCESRENHKIVACLRQNRHGGTVYCILYDWQAVKRCLMQETVTLVSRVGRISISRLIVKPSRASAELKFNRRDFPIDHGKCNSLLQSAFLPHRKEVSMSSINLWSDTRYFRKPLYGANNFGGGFLTIWDARNSSFR